MTDDVSIPTLDRRTVLGTLATTAGALAGCQSLTGGNNSSAAGPAQPSKSSPFKKIAYKAQGDDFGYKIKLTVKFDDGADISQINIIAPDGSRYKKTGVPAGAQKVSLTVATDSTTQDPIAPHQEYTLAAIANGEVVDKHSFTYSPSVSITDLIPGQEKEGANDDSLVLRFQNSGNAPVYFRNVVVTNGPHSVKDWRDSYEYHPLPREIIPANGTIEKSLKEFYKPGYSCPDGLNKKECTIQPTLEPVSDPTYKASISYRDVESFCRPSIQSWGKSE